MGDEIIEKNIYEILYTDEKFPEYLKCVKPQIKRIFAYGNLSILQKKSVAVIGSRNCSDYGRKIAKEMTEVLVDNNIVIVSGMALGIDTIAHETCIARGGKTIAVLGSGLKNIFPKENTNLFHKIIESGGLIISEYSLDEPVQMKNFPKRNRIISGLSDGVLVVEASYRSGTSITAKYARSQGKTIFCVPNSIGNKNSYGSIELAKSGAKMVTSGYEILLELGIKFCKGKKCRKQDVDNKINNMDANTRAIFQCLKENECLDCEQISCKTDIDTIVVNQTLTYMELDEIVENIKINKYKLCDKYCE
ncbi:MAG: DNA-processing protein DprA [Clostridia bacterium]|nr:DNA-processing protein DprA [Clostridia bacterium]